MGVDAIRRARLEELLQLAQAYRGWNRRQLARALGRDASNLVPASGFPKIDLIVELSRVLDWRVEDIVNSFWLHEATDATNGRALPEGDFEELERLAKQASRGGRHDEAVELAVHAGSIAQTPEQRAIALTREASAWDGLGRYMEALDASKRGLAVPGVSTDRRLILQINLANEYYTLWHPIESRSMAHDLIHRYQQEPARNRMNRVSEAFAYYVRGNSCRRLMAVDESRDVEYAQLARTDLQRAQQLFVALAGDYDEDSYRGIANTCDGGIVESEVVLGRRDAESALVEITDRLDAIVNPSECASGDWLESYGWWCIYGCNVALRHLKEHRQVQHHLAVFTNKADEIAEITNNWAMRERIVTMQYARRQCFADWTGIDADWTIDADDVRAIAGTMGRFSRFHETGWKVLRSARILRQSERNGTAQHGTKPHGTRPTRRRPAPVAAVRPSIRCRLHRANEGRTIDRYHAAMWKQMTYFTFGLPDEPGELARFAQQLQDAGVNLISLWGEAAGKGSKSRFGCVPASAAAFRVFMQTADFRMEEGQTFYCTGQDRPGALIDALTRIAGAGINIDAIETVAAGEQFGCFIWADEKAWPRLAALLRTEPR